MRSLIASVVLGYVNGAFFQQSEAQNAEFILYNFIPFGIALDKIYVAFQAFNNPVAVAQTLSLAQTEAQMLYAQLLPTLGYDFLSQFDELELLSFFLQARDCNIDLSLELLLTNASLAYAAAAAAGAAAPQQQLQQAFTWYLFTLYFSLLTLFPFKSETRVLFLDKIENRVENLVYTENVRSNFLNFYLKMVKILPFLILKLRHLFKLRPTHNSSAVFKVTVNLGNHLFCLGIV